MRKLLMLAGLCAVAVGCSSSNGDPASACNNAVNTICNKLSSCNSLNGSTVAQCITAAEAAATCATRTCPSGTSFDSNLATTCINDINNASCANVSGGTFPASCNVAFCH
jgi:hypothetical protein